MGVFSEPAITALGTKKAAMEVMHADVQALLKAAEASSRMVAWQKLRELDNLIAAAVLAAEAVELHNDDELQSNLVVP